jgi:hypothetical protein
MALPIASLSGIDLNIEKAGISPLVALAYSKLTLLEA